MIELRFDTIEVYLVDSQNKFKMWTPGKKDSGWDFALFLGVGMGLKKNWGGRIYLVGRGT